MIRPLFITDAYFWRYRTPTLICRQSLYFFLSLSWIVRFSIHLYSYSWHLLADTYSFPWTRGKSGQRINFFFKWINSNNDCILSKLHDICNTYNNLFKKIVIHILILIVLFALLPPSSYGLMMIQFKPSLLRVYCNSYIFVSLGQWFILIHLSVTWQ